MGSRHRHGGCGQPKCCNSSASNSPFGFDFPGATNDGSAIATIYAADNSSTTPQGPVNFYRDGRITFQSTTLAIGVTTGTGGQPVVTIDLPIISVFAYLVNQGLGINTWTDLQIPEPVIPPFSDVTYGVTGGQTYFSSTTGNKEISIHIPYAVDSGTFFSVRAVMDIGGVETQVAQATETLSGAALQNSIDLNFPLDVPLDQLSFQVLTDAAASSVFNGAVAADGTPISNGVVIIRGF